MGVLSWTSLSVYLSAHKYEHVLCKWPQTSLRTVNIDLFLPRGLSVLIYSFSATRCKLAGLCRCHGKRAEYPYLVFFLSAWLARSYERQLFHTWFIEKICLTQAAVLLTNCFRWIRGHSTWLLDRASGWALFAACMRHTSPLYIWENFLWRISLS
jgi:hypothetical protein